MAGVNRLNYNNSLVNEKANYFFDLYDYLIFGSGYLWYLDLENPLSLANKICYQLESNIDNAHYYLTTYFSKLRNIDSRYGGLFTSFSHVLEQTQTYNNLPSANQQKRWLKANQSALLLLFRTFLQELDVAMISNSIKRIIAILSCKHSLAKHKKEIYFHCSIISSEVLYRKQDKKEAIKLVGAIFSNDIRSFPFPTTVKDHEEKKKYLENSKFDTAYWAILDFLNKDVDIKYVLCRLNGLLLNKKDAFQLGEVTIYSIQHTAMSGLRKFLSSRKKSLIRDAFDSKNTTIALVKVEQSENGIAQKEALKLVEDTLLYINRTLVINITVDAKSYLYSDDLKGFGYQAPLIKSDKTLSTDQLAELNDNAHYYLRNKNYASKDDFLRFEFDFLRARENIDISGLIRYLEILTKLEYNDYREMIAASMLHKERTFTERTIQSYISTVVDHMNTSHTRLGITLEEQDLYTSHDFKFTRSNCKAKSNVLKDILYISTRNMTQKIKTEIKKHYESIIREGYEQRNAVVHEGTYNHRANFKLATALNVVITRFRWVIFDYMRKYPNISLGQLLIHIKDDSFMHFQP